MLWLVYSATFGGGRFSANLVIFFTWTMALIFLVEAVCPKKAARERILQGYREGKHLPEWMDFFFYGSAIFMLVGNGWFATAIGWVLMGVVDLGFRHEAQEEDPKG